MEVRRGELDRNLYNLREKIGEMYTIARGLLYYSSSLKQDIIQEYQDAKRELAIKQLTDMPLEMLNSQKEGFRIAPLKKEGYGNIWQVMNAREYMLSEINGISEAGASAIQEKCKNIYQDVYDRSVFRMNFDSRNERSDKIAKNMYILKHSNVDAYMLNFALRAVNECSARLDMIGNQLNPLKWLFTNRAVKESVAQAMDDIYENLLWHEKKIYEEKQKADAVTNQSMETVWDDYMQNAATYQAELEEIVGDLARTTHKSGGKKIALWDYFTPQFGSYNIENYGDDVRELVDRVNGYELKTGFLRATLRRYQTFGTKYMLSQKRTLLGDEMGLGKTLQAIAAMAHLKECGKTTFLVVCPLSVLINWTREVEKHTLFGAIAIYGDDWDEEFSEWKEKKGVAITTYETLRKMEESSVGDIDMLVVDEAHYVKNPEAQRTKELLKIKEKAEYILYMTGTPIENKVSEMVYLIECLNPDVADKVRHMEQSKQAEDYRVSVSPVYLRRTREDVLQELPELIEIEDWLFPNEEEMTIYRDSLARGTIGEVRRVSWTAPCEKSSKLSKLVELCQEASEDGRKILVFSFFVNTIEIVSETLGENCAGVITGNVSASERQEILDRFGQSKAGSVLVCQIQAGGVGLNIQAASVVVFCEPQYKPSIEKQAIARAYRMGQARNVFVHRLLMKNTVDERIMEILSEKALIFDQFAETSEVGEQDIKMNEMISTQALLKSEMERHGVNREVDE